MADAASSKDLEALTTGIVDSIKSIGATEQAIHKQIQAALAASTTVLADLVKDNAYPAELAQENLKIQKAVIQQTIDAINNLDTLVPKNK